MSIRSPLRRSDTGQPLSRIRWSRNESDFHRAEEEPCIVVGKDVGVRMCACMCTFQKCLTTANWNQIQLTGLSALLELCTFSSRVMRYLLHHLRHARYARIAYSYVRLAPALCCAYSYLRIGSRYCSLFLRALFPGFRRLQRRHAHAAPLRRFSAAGRGVVGRGVRSAEVLAVFFF